MSGWSQWFPEDSATLHYRMIGFTFPKVRNADNYIVEIARVNGQIPDFETDRIIAAPAKSNQVVITVPTFNSTYAWRVISRQGSATVSKSEVRTFVTGYSLYVDTSKMRMTVNHPAGAFKDAFVFADATKALYDMEGQPIWYLPSLNGIVRENGSVRDLKISNRGTITFLLEGDAYEIDYKGNVLWQGPGGHHQKNDSLLEYHHELTRLSNGHYMVLGFDPISKKSVGMKRDSMLKAARTDTAQLRAARAALRKPRFGNILEYDENGKLVWMWDAAGFFRNFDLKQYYYVNDVSQNDVHENSFWFDEANKVIYVSFRNISLVIKISYPSGKLLRSYSGLSHPATDSISGYFCGQHSCRVSEHGYMYLFDNGCNLEELPKVIRLKEPLTANDTLTDIWEFNCPFERANRELPHRKLQFTSGGNVIELPDSSLFVSSCSPFGNLFIVSNEKAISWFSTLEKYNATTNAWQPLPLYRGSIIVNRETLENVILYPGKK